MERVLSLAGSVNFRDIGGYESADGRRVKWGHVFRSGRLDKLADSASDQLVNRGIRTLVDLRFPEESERFPTVMDGFANATVIRWQAPEGSSRKPKHLKNMLDEFRDSDADGMRRIMRERTGTFLESHADVYRQLILALADGGAPLVYHCSAGKDRTGAATALLLSLLGVSKAQVIEDYVLTQTQLADRMEAWIAGGVAPDTRYTELLDFMGDMPHEQVRPLFDADESYINALFAHADSNYGGFENYCINHLDIPTEKLAQLNNQLLEEAA